MSDDSASRIEAELRKWISTAAPGAQVPSTRALVERYSASPVTVQKALRALGAVGLVESRPGVGTFVRTHRTSRPADFSWQTAALGTPDLRLPRRSTTMRGGALDAIALHAGYPDRELLAQRLVRTALGRAARDARALERADAQGVPELREWFAHELSAGMPAGQPAPAGRDVLVVPGSQSGLGSVFRALVGPGQPMVVESPTYWGAIHAASRAGVELVPVASGPAGPDPREVGRALATSGARAFYAQPSFANPTGAQWSAGTTRAVLDTVRSHNAFLVEDDWAHDFAIETEVRPVVASDSDGCVVYVRSLTKSVSPALRVAAVIARGPARERIRADQSAESMYVSGALQVAALDVVTQPAWGTHLRRLREQLGSRRDLLVASLAEHVPQAHLAHVPRGGLNLWLQLPDGTDVARLARECETDGVLIAPGDEWFPAEPAGSFVRLNYAGPEPGRYEEAAAVIGRALDEQSR